MCLLDFLDGIYNNIDDGTFSGVLFLDLKKTFDSVNHMHLVCKLYTAGLNPFTLKWFGSYLDNRRQKTKINGTLSNSARVEYGVPQGSILGALLFVIFTNDLPQSVTDCAIHLYTDDAAITVKATSTDDLNDKLNSKLAESFK